MKKLLAVMMCIIALVMCACSAGGHGTTETQWDCSVSCADKSAEDEYVITYSDMEIVPHKSALTFQNRSDFEITVHLFTDGADEQSFTVQPGGVYVLHQVKNHEVYTVGMHGNVADGTPINLMVYDGEKAEVY